MHSLTFRLCYDDPRKIKLKNLIHRHAAVILEEFCTFSKLHEKTWQFDSICIGTAQCQLVFGVLDSKMCNFKAAKL